MGPEDICCPDTLASNTLNALATPLGPDNELNSCLPAPLRRGNILRAGEIVDSRSSNVLQ